MRFLGMALVSNGKNEVREDVSVQGPDAPLAHRRPGYSLSGCTPAEPDSASPGVKSLAELPGPAQGERTTSVHWITQPRESPAHKNRRLDTPVHGMDAPKEVQKNKTGVPVEGLLTSFFL